jgi:hypothetical protein
MMVSAWQRGKKAATDRHARKIPLARLRSQVQGPPQYRERRLARCFGQGRMRVHR